MGASYSASNMDSDLLTSSSGSDSDASDIETSYSELFRRLIRRYTNTFNAVGGQQHVAFLKRKNKYKPNTSQIEMSDYAERTRIDSGVGPYQQDYSNVALFLNDRATGAFRNDAQSARKRCRISNNFIPNTMVLFDNYESKVFVGVYSSDGQYYITASQDQFIKIYKIRNGHYKLVQIFNALDVGWSIIDVAFCPKNESFVYSTWSTSLQLCKVEGDPERQRALNLVHTARRFCVFACVYSSDGKKILGGSNDGIMFIYDLEKNMRTLKISAHEYDVNTVQFADNSSQIIYSGSDDGLIKVWDRRTFSDEGPAKPVGVLAGHRDGIVYIDTHEDGRHLISNSKDQSIKLWDVRKFSSETAATATLKAVHEQTWDYRWQTVPRREASKLEGDTSIMTYHSHSITRTLVRCRFSPMATTGQRYIYTGCGTGKLYIYDSLTGKVKLDERKHKACVRDVSWHPYNNEIMTASWDGTVGRWFYTHQERCELKQDSPQILRRSARIAKNLLDKKRQESTETM